MKILIVRVGRAGDMVMITPAISALLKHYPDANFTLLASPEGHRVLGDFSDRIQAITVYDRKLPWSLFARGAIRGKIASAQFDHIYCFEYTPKYYRLFGESPAQVHGLNRLKGEKHYAQLCLDLVSMGVGHDVGPYPLHLPVGGEAEDKNKHYLTQFGITENSMLLALHPTYSAAGKRFGRWKHKRNKLWLPESYGALCDRLHIDAQRRGVDLKLVMNLMPDECAIGKKIVDCSRGSVALLSPPPDFQAYKAFLKRADLLVTPDTGPMHMAAALGTPVVALFAGKDPNDCGPFVPEARRRILRAEETETPEGGIAAIGVEAVYRACIALMGSRPRSSPRAAPAPF